MGRNLYRYKIKLKYEIKVGDKISFINFKNGVQIIVKRVVRRINNSGTLNVYYRNNKNWYLFPSEILEVDYK